jgi:hypothetical protein
MVRNEIFVVALMCWCRWLEDMSCSWMKVSYNISNLEGSSK